MIGRTAWRRPSPELSREPARCPADRRRPKPAPVTSFDRKELNTILNLYGRKVAAGEWRDYALDFLRERAVFSVFARASERPLYMIEKTPKLRAKQGQYMVLGPGRPHPQARARPRLRVPARARAETRPGRVISVRPAAAADVPAMSRVLTRSITELCAADHRGDPALVARWTANKSVAGVGRMLANEGVTLLVAERDGAIAAVGAIIEPDTIGLNYVDPDHRFAGVSKALLEAMEGATARCGVAEGKLHSTRPRTGSISTPDGLDAGPPEAWDWDARLSDAKVLG